MMNERKLAALRELLDPEAVAAWLDEVQSCRTRPTQQKAIPRPSPVAPVEVDTRIITVAEVAERVRMSKHVIYDMVRRNEIPHVRIGRKIRFGSQVINDWIAEGGCMDRWTPRYEGEA